MDIRTAPGALPADLSARPQFFSGCVPDPTWDAHDEDLLALIRSSSGEPRSSEFTGIKSLMVAILEEGIRSYMSGSSSVRNEAERWIHRKRQRSVFSFEVICETLELDPGAVRRVLANMREKSSGGNGGLPKTRFRGHPGRRRDIDVPDDGTMG